MMPNETQKKYPHKTANMYIVNKSYIFKAKFLPNDVTILIEPLDCGLCILTISEQLNLSLDGLPSSVPPTIQNEFLLRAIQAAFARLTFNLLFIV